MAEQFHQSILEEYEKQNRLLTFEEYIQAVRNEPSQQLRSSSQYLVDAMDFFGKDGKRFRLFDQEFADRRFRLIGQEQVQDHIYQILKSFVREGVNNKVILLHGPNGSAKSSIVACLMRGLEDYSQQPKGALYRFHWIFPVDRHGKPGLGLSGSASPKEEEHSFAKLPDSEIATRVSCELKDHPLFLLPIKERAHFIQGLKLESGFTLSEYIQKGDLSHKSKRIFEALLRSYKGDVRKVLRHVQVERFYISRRYREAAVSIEPQMHVDANAQQVTMDRSLSQLPPALQSLSLIDLGGDLVDGNRGIVEYNDLLKRPIDTFKYLLATTETGTVSVAGTVAFLDTVLIGTCNEAQLDAFKEYPDFPSFRARMELVRVPYLLNYKREAEIYEVQGRRVAGDRHVAPHALSSAALWAVLCRLKKPNPSHYPGNAAYVMNSIGPLEKARILSDGTLPMRMSSEEKKILKALIEEIHREYSNVPYYEGRVGPSPREMKVILFQALERNERGILSPLGLFAELEDFVKHTSEFDYLREDVVEGYHDCRQFVSTVRDHYLDELDKEVRSCLGMHDEKQYSDFLKKYVQHLSAHLKKEKIRNAVTDRLEDPDRTLMDEFEKVVEATDDRDLFRQNLMTQLGVYALENPQRNRDGVEYGKVFPDLVQKVRDHYIDEHTQLMKRVQDALTIFQGDGDPAKERLKTLEQQEANKIAQRMIKNMVEKYSYNEVSAREAFAFLIQKRY
jgi:serine protein kinase